jgi:hypothetical protein
MTWLEMTNSGYKRLTKRIIATALYTRCMLCSSTTDAQACHAEDDTAGIARNLSEMRTHNVQ